MPGYMKYVNSDPSFSKQKKVLHFSSLIFKIDLRVSDTIATKNYFNVYPNSD